MIEWRCLANYQFNSEAKKIVSFEAILNIKTHTIFNILWQARHLQIV